MIVRITNEYVDGIRSLTEAWVQDPPCLSEDFWDEVVWPLTGTRRYGVDATYRAEIVVATDERHVGLSRVWD